MVKGDGESASLAPIDLNILIRFINKFDGSRDKLNAFLNNCKNALNLASASQTDILFKYILSQLEGRAEVACSIKEFEKWEQLEEFLKENFGEKKHYSHLLSELQNSKQQYNESVNQFGLRVETCLSKLLTEINVSIPTNKKQELAGRVAAMEDLALHTFVSGLQSKLSTVLRCRNPKTLNEAINFAVSEEKLLHSANKPPQGHDRSRPSTSREYMYKPSVHTSQQLAITNSPHSSNPLICRYCKAEGHSIEKCRKREYNNSRRQNFSTNQRSSARSEQTFVRSFQPRNVNYVQENNPTDTYVVETPDDNSDRENLN